MTSQFQFRDARGLRASINRHMSPKEKTMPDHRPDPVDLYVGARLRQKRNECERSQQWLGDKLGLTFQQIQKYEKGTNRISASMLVRASKAMKTPVEWFFEGLEGMPVGTTASDARGRERQIWSATSEGVLWIDAGRHLSSRMLSIITEMAQNLSVHANERKAA